MSNTTERLLSETDAVGVESLEGTALDEAVAKAAGMEARIQGRWCIADDSGFPFRPSTQWKDGGPIIERERIATHPRSDCGLGDHWGAMPYTEAGVGAWHLMQRGASPLIAAMRVYVASKASGNLPKRAD